MGWPPDAVDELGRIAGLLPPTQRLAVTTASHRRIAAADQSGQDSHTVRDADASVQFTGETCVELRRDQDRYHCALARIKTR